MTKDIVLGLVALAFAALYIVEASRIPTSALGDAVGAGGIPVILGWIMAGAAAILILQELWARRTGRAAAAVAPEVSEAFREPGRTALVAGGVILMGALYIAALRTLGYIPSTLLLLAGMLLYQRVPLSRRLLVVPLIGTLALWLLFDAFLGIDLPDGPLAGLL